jgi:hypothetical protein
MTEHANDRKEPMPLQAARAAAAADHARVVGTVIDTDWLIGYVGNDSADFRCDPPVKVRVLPTSAEDLAHQVDQWLDPYWDVELAEPVAWLEGVRSFWIFGPSYEIAKEAK